MKFDVVIIGGGASGMEALAKYSGRRVAVISKGLSIHNVAHPATEGVSFFEGDSVTGAELRDGKVIAVTAEKMGRIEADEFVLATGKYFGGGIVADMTRVYEPVFGLDVEYEQDREKWFKEDFFAPQPFLDFGVKVDSKGHPSIGGVKIANLVATGEVLSGNHKVIE
ncbi:MAG: FAD-binding protein [Bacteroidales bacterium]|nr:FAD-binding protein [Bacteroidales bacterium]